MNSEELKIVSDILKQNSEIVSKLFKMENISIVCEKNDEIIGNLKKTFSESVFGVIEKTKCNAEDGLYTYPNVINCTVGVGTLPYSPDSASVGIRLKDDVNMRALFDKIDEHIEKCENHELMLSDALSGLYKCELWRHWFPWGCPNLAYKYSHISPEDHLLIMYFSKKEEDR